MFVLGGVDSHDMFQRLAFVSTSRHLEVGFMGFWCSRATAGKGVGGFTKTLENMGSPLIHGRKYNINALFNVVFCCFFFLGGGGGYFIPK